MVNEQASYCCPYCDSQHLFYEKALDCLSECALENAEDVYEGVLYICNCCSTEFDKEKEGIECELKHKNSQDLLYGQYLWRKSQEDLEKARNHPEQKRLGEWSI